MSDTNHFQMMTDTILAAAKSPEVAHAAKINYTHWALHHVFTGQTNFIRGRNRGRSPFLTVTTGSSDINIITHDSNEEEFTFDILCDVSGRDRLAATGICQRILRAFLGELTSDQQWFGLSATFTPIEETGFGFRQTVSITKSIIDDDGDFGADEVW